MRPEAQLALDRAVDELQSGYVHGQAETYIDGDGTHHPVTVIYSELPAQSSPLEMGIENQRPFAKMKVVEGLNPQRGEWITIGGSPREIISVERIVSRKLLRLYLNEIE